MSPSHQITGLQTDHSDKQALSQLDRSQALLGRPYQTTGLQSRHQITVTDRLSANWPDHRPHRADLNWITSLKPRYLTQ
eukprot:1159185-Pelagomonas_calceolata.AAC.3